MIAKNQVLGPEARVQVPPPPFLHWLASDNSRDSTFHSSIMQLMILSAFRVPQRPNEMMPVEFHSVHGMLHIENVISTRKGLLSVLFTEESPAPRTGPGPE